VVATAPDIGALRELVAKAPDRVAVLAFDVTHPGEAEAAIGAAISRFGQLDVLINAAGTTIATSDAGDAELRTLTEAGFYGTMTVTGAALPIFRAQGWGAIVNISSMGEAMSPSSFRAYAAGKFALEGASEALAQEMAPFGVRVMILEPGHFRTDQADRQAHGGSLGDPAKAAAAVETALEADVTPLRLALGGDAVDAIRSHCQTLLADLAKWEPISRATGF